MSDTRLVKTVMLGMTDGTRPRGRPPRKWSDDIEEWYNCTSPEAVRLTEYKRGEKVSMLSLDSTAHMPAMSRKKKKTAI